MMKKKNNIPNTTPIEKEDFIEKEIFEENEKQYIENVESVKKLIDISNLTLSSSGYIRVKQNNALTNFRNTTLTTKIKKEHYFDSVTNNFIVSDGDFRLLFEKFDKNKTKLTNVDHKFLDIFMACYLDGLHKGNIATLSLDEFMKIRNLKSKSTTRRQVLKSLNNLSEIKLEYNGKNTTYDNSFAFMRILSSGIIGNGVIQVGFTNEFLALIHKAAAFLLPKAIYRVSDNDYPNTYQIGNYLYRNKRMNEGEKRANVVKIKNILENCVNLPTYEDVKNGNRNFRGKIINRFLLDLEQITSIEYGFIDPSGKTIKKYSDYFDKCSFFEFENSSIVINQWIDFPNDYDITTPIKKEKYRKRAEKKKEKEK